MRFFLFLAFVVVPIVEIGLFLKVGSYIGVPATLALIIVTAIAGTMLADFILLGHEKSGSWALSSDKTELFGVALGAYLDEIAAVFNRHAIPRLLQVNGMPLNAPPHLVHGDIETVDLERLGNFIKALSQSGAAIFPNPELEAWLAAQAGMPATSEAGAEL